MKVVVVADENYYCRQQGHVYFFPVCVVEPLRDWMCTKTKSSLEVYWRCLFFGYKNILVGHKPRQWFMDLMAIHQADNLIITCR